MPGDTRQITVRLPAVVADKLEAKAAAAERTVAQEVRLIVRAHVEDGAS